MLVIYNIILITLAIIFSPLIIIALIIQPKFRAGFFQKMGMYQSLSNGKSTVVFHAVSVGEINAVKAVIKQYSILHPDENIVITTTTRTGQMLAKTVFADIAERFTYFPFDFCFSVISFLNAFNPEKIIIAETEIWPGFMLISKLRGVKVYTINGRISPHSYNGYKKIKLFLAPILNCYEKIFMQSPSDAQRIKDLGAKSDKVEVMGNLKFDITQNLKEEEVAIYADELKTTNYRLFIAASTHKGEDEIVLKAFKALKEKHSDAKLLIAPRHPERYCDVESLIKESGYTWGKRSTKDNFDNADVIMLDTMGELSKLFSLCYIAFIGGSFSHTGGHNPLEANIWGKPVLSGTVVFNFKDVYKTAVEKKCAVLVSNTEELTSELISFYDNALKYKTFSSNAKAIFDENRGAINYVLTRI